MRKLFTLGAVLALAVVTIGVTIGTTIGIASAAGGLKPKAHAWSFEGITGTYDRAALRRGLQVYLEVCASCHSLNLLAYRHLGGVGFTGDEIKAIAAEFEVEDGPNDDGEMFSRTARPSDHFPVPFENDQSARAANAGALPPDLSVINKARKGGANYLYALLTGYKEEAPQGFELMEGMSYNDYFPGNQIAMPSPLSEDSVEYADGTKASVEQLAADVTVFLEWAGEPGMEDRKRLGIKVLLFLLVLTAMLYALKRQIWADLH
jgi:cytochrome c1